MRRKRKPRNNGSSISGRGEPDMNNSDPTSDHLEDWDITDPDLAGDEAWESLALDEPEESLPEYGDFWPDADDSDLDGFDD